MRYWVILCGGEIAWLLWAMHGSQLKSSFITFHFLPSVRCVSNSLRIFDKDMCRMPFEFWSILCLCSLIFTNKSLFADTSNGLLWTQLGI
jgi:hypothetical protein